MLNWKSTGRMRLLGSLGCLMWALGSSANAQQPPLKLGVLTDMSSLYADVTGPGSVIAAKMAVEDFWRRRIA